jgi:hypothetical protein
MTKEPKTEQVQKCQGKSDGWQGCFLLFFVSRSKSWSMCFFRLWWFAIFLLLQTQNWWFSNFISSLIHLFLYEVLMSLPQHDFFSLILFDLRSFIRIFSHVVFSVLCFLLHRYSSSVHISLSAWNPVSWCRGAFWCFGWVRSHCWKSCTSINFSPLNQEVRFSLVSYPCWIFLSLCLLPNSSSFFCLFILFLIFFLFCSFPLLWQIYWDLQSHKNPKGRVTSCGAQESCSEKQWAE